MISLFQLPKFYDLMGFLSQIEYPTYFYTPVPQSHFFYDRALTKFEKDESSKRNADVKGIVRDSNKGVATAQDVS